MKMNSMKGRLKGNKDNSKRRELLKSICLNRRQSLRRQGRRFWRTLLLGYGFLEFLRANNNNLLSGVLAAVDKLK